MTLRTYLRPTGLLPAETALSGNLPLAGGRFTFSIAELILRDGDSIERTMMPLNQLPAEFHEIHRRHLDALTRPRSPLAGLSLDRPRLMAVLNVTPDSFSDGGAFLEPAQALAHGMALLEAGADIIDIGGESTRPGAAPVSPECELERVLPVVSALAERGAQVSIDTRHAAVMRAALAAGAVIINDVTGLTGDAESLAVVAESTAPVVLMHMQGEPGTMQNKPHYHDAALDVYDWLEARVNACRAAGISTERIIVDPGIGFGKTLEHNLEILRALTLYHGLGCPLMVGVSRKRFIGALSNNEPPGDRVPWTVAASRAALDGGCQMVGVHDLAARHQARAVWEGLNPPIKP